MIGDMISRIRKDKRITKTQLSEMTDINIGHLTHIEKGERNPSHKALKNICSSLNVPFEPLLHTYDKELNEEQKEYNYTKYISYNQIPAITNLDNYIDCPAKYANASFAYKVQDSSMAPTIQENSYAYIEINGLVQNKDIGLFKYNGEFMIRRLMYKKGKFVLKAENKEIPNITISDNDTFSIIGKVYI